MARRVAVALVHYPVYDAQKREVTTAITNLDVHDLARSARSYGCSDYFIVHPIDAQRELVRKICSHWEEGSSGKRIPDRKLALALVRCVATIDEAIATFGVGEPVELWVTAAREVAPPLNFADARERLATEGPPVLILFGTGWGLSQTLIERAAFTLAPIRAVRSDYNHLSVRAACAIALDRLLGQR